MLIGTMVRHSAEWRVPATPDATLTDPTTVTLQVRLPSQTLLTSTYLGASDAGAITRDATGQYHADYLPLTVGTHRWRWAGTGAATAAAEGQYTIDASTL
jgi:hypothetical protein